MQQTLQGRRVLVVEDEFLLADDLARSLNELGCEVVGPVSDRRGVIEALDGRQVDLVILDLNLRGDEAFDLADRVIERGKPCIFATGYGADAIPEHLRHLPRWEKPFDTDALAASLADIPV